MSLLHSEGYHDIHLIHGPFESGKDIIAKRLDGDELVQYAIQSKAGDMGASGWRENRQQIELIWDSQIGHPAFDPSLRRRAVLAFNGKFKGTAAVEAQHYNEARIKRKEDPCLFWTAEDLIPRFVAMLQQSNGYGLESMRLLEAVTRLHRGELDADDIEQFTWNPTEEDSSWIPAAALSCLLLGELAAKAKQLDCSLSAAYGLIRLAWANEVDGTPVTWVRDAGRAFFAALAEGVEESISENSAPRALIEPMRSLSPFATYPIKCSIIIEIMGMHSLAPWRSREERLKSTEVLANFVERNPGTSKPLSDRWAVSLIPASIALHVSGREELTKDLLMNTADWLFDSIESGLGVAPRHSEPAEEVGRIFGRSFESTGYARRSSSYVATVVIDLAHVLGYGELYADLVNDLAAVRGTAELCAAPPGRGEFEQSSREHYHFASLEYAYQYDAEGRPSQHYGEEVDRSTVTAAGSAWDSLAIYGLFRDRHTPNTLRQLVKEL